jgi:uncharacterized protein YjbI with pentapeptide repeats
VPDDPRLDFTPDWPTCATEGCRGIRVSGAFCLAHAVDGGTEFLASLYPGADLDLRGTILTAELFRRIVERFRAEDGWSYYGTVLFSRVWFTGDAGFGLAVFAGYARFDSACFSGSARFLNVDFEDGVNFGAARFAAADLRIKTLGTAHFLLAQFAERAVLAIEASRIELHEVRFAKGVALRLLAGALDATGTVFGEPASISGRVGGRSLVEVVSLRDVDVRGLVLTDVSLRRCAFTGAHGLEQLRIEGYCPFHRPRGTWWLTRRQMLAEEVTWRGWADRPPDEPIGPARLAGMYRSLRKSFEDSKNEAGAGDFYYGEMEMRRRSEETSRAEKTILWFYWLVSGYGQRASRALAALFVVVAVVTALLTAWGQDFGMASRIAVGAVVFRDDRTELTAAGEWTVLTARFLGPVLLALAVLAIRARVKR